jgi:hypothetical protein
MNNNTIHEKYREYTDQTSPPSIQHHIDQLEKEVGWIAETIEKIGMKTSAVRLDPAYPCESNDKEISVPMSPVAERICRISRVVYEQRGLLEKICDQIQL